MMQSDTLITIFSGYNQRAVIAFLRTLETHQVPYALIAKSPEDSIWDTVYAKKVLAVRSKKELDMCDLLDCLTTVKAQTGYNKCLIAPSTEALNRYLLEHRADFENQDCTIPLVDEPLYQQLSDKYSFCRMCEQHAISIPAETPIIDQLSLPFVAKPKTYFSTNLAVYSPQLIFTEADKQHFIYTYDSHEFYYQQYVTGASYYLLYYFDKQGRVFKFSQENLLQQPNGKSIVAASTSTVHTEPISLLYETMLRSVGFRGIIMIELKKQAQTYYMIEANPRFWGPSQLFLHANMNFFEAFLWDYGFIPNPPAFTHPVSSLYFWYGGIFESGKENMAIHAPLGEDMLNHPDNYLNYDVYKKDDTLTLFLKETQL